MHRLLILLVLGVDLVRDCSSQLRCTNSSGQGVYVWSGSRLCYTAWVKTGKAQCEQMFSALPPKNGHRATTAACPFGAKKATQHELKAPTGFADRQPAIAKGLSAAMALQLSA